MADYRCIHCKTYEENFQCLIDHLVQFHPEKNFEYLKKEDGGAKSCKYRKRSIPGCVPMQILETDRVIKIDPNNKSDGILICQISKSTREKKIKNTV